MKGAPHLDGVREFGILLEGVDRLPKRRDGALQGGATITVRPGVQCPRVVVQHAREIRALPARCEARGEHLVRLKGSVERLA